MGYIIHEDDPNEYKMCLFLLALLPYSMMVYPFVLHFRLSFVEDWISGHAMGFEKKQPPKADQGVSL